MEAEKSLETIVDKLQNFLYAHDLSLHVNFGKDDETGEDIIHCARLASPDSDYSQQYLKRLEENQVSSDDKVNKFIIKDTNSKNILFVGGDSFHGDVTHGDSVWKKNPNSGTMALKNLLKYDKHGHLYDILNFVDPDKKGAWGNNTHKVCDEW